MSFSREHNEKANIERTPTPGGDYSSLLNDSSTNKYTEEDLDNIREYSPIEKKFDTHAEIIQLRSENEYLKAQLEIANKEKELHIQSNAQERNKAKKFILNMKTLMQNEISKLLRENQDLTEKNAEIEKKIQKDQSVKLEKLSFYKKQLETQEKHYQILLNDKDRVINSLKSSIQDKKTSGVPSSRKKKSVSKRISALPSNFPSSKSSSLGFFASPRQKLDEITELIVKLEKKQAELKESAPEEEDFYENYLSLKDLTRKSDLSSTQKRAKVRLNNF